jgi:hypothetical protein
LLLCACFAAAVVAALSGIRTGTVQGGVSDPCRSRYPAGQVTESKFLRGTRQVFDREAGLYQVCEGFGAPDTAGFTLTPTQQCAIIAAAATFRGPVVSAGVSHGCEAGEIVTDFRGHHWLGLAKDVGCGYFSDIFAGSIGIFVAGAASPTGPGAVAVGVVTYKALSASLKLVCGGVFIGPPTQLGHELEARHETAVALDIIRRGKCLEETRKPVIGLQWSAVTCRASLGTFAGTWSGHTRGLTITPTGHARESIGDGCCDPIIDLTFQLSRPAGTWLNATVTATVISVAVHDKSAFAPGHRPPHLGQKGQLRLRDGVITEPLTGTLYCDMAADLKGTCGA